MLAWIQAVAAAAEASARHQINMCVSGKITYQTKTLLQWNMTTGRYKARTRATLRTFDRYPVSRTANIVNIDANSSKLRISRSKFYLSVDAIAKSSSGNRLISLEETVMSYRHHPVLITRVRRRSLRAPISETLQLSVASLNLVPNWWRKARNLTNESSKFKFKLSVHQ